MAIAAMLSAAGKLDVSTECYGVFVGIFSIPIPIDLRHIYKC